MFTTTSPTLCSQTYLAVQGDPGHVRVGWVKAVGVLGIHQFQVVALAALVAGLYLIPVHGGQPSTLLGHSWGLLLPMCEGAVQEWPESSPGRQWMVSGCTVSHAITHTPSHTHTHTHMCTHTHLDG